MTDILAEPWLVETMRKHRLPGLAVGVLAQRRVVGAMCWGHADLTERRLVAPHTAFRVGSISKTFTAIGLLRLWEQGRVQLDDPVNSYLRTFQVRSPPGAPPVTCRHLLTHTAGLGLLRRFRDVLEPGAGLEYSEGVMAPNLAQYYAGGIETRSPPGIRWRYSNQGFAIIGQLIEDIAGVPFAEFMRAEIFEPLGMFRTHFRHGEQARQDLARGYQSSWGKLRAVDYFQIVLEPAGSAVSTLDDLLAYASALLGGSHSISGSLRPETLRRLLTPQYQLDPRLPEAMGLGFLLDRWGGHMMAWHNGALRGFTGVIYLAPDEGAGAVVLTNMLVDGVLEGIAERLLRGMLGLPEPAAALAAARVEPRPHEWRSLAGVYAPAESFWRAPLAWLTVGCGWMVRVATDHLSVRERLPGQGMWGGLRLYHIRSDDPLVFGGLRDGKPVTACFSQYGTGRIQRLYSYLDVVLERR